MMEAFEEWYLTEHQRVLGACFVFAGNREVAGEATDEAFARALERWSTVAAMAAPAAWVHVVALNHVRRLLRRRSLENRFVARSRIRSSDAQLPNPELWRAVRGLPLRQRTAVVLRYVGDLSEAEIATAMSTSRGNVARTLHDARERLRDQLAAQSDKEPVDG
jgi:RNA polymerase sigma factor (sigma-70 family)